MLEKVLQKKDGHEKTPKDQKKPVSIVLELSKKMFTNCSDDGLNMFENFVFGVWKCYGNESLHLLVKLFTLFNSMIF